MNDRLSNEIETLRAQIETNDKWAYSLYLALEAILPFLLRGHPNAGAIRQRLEQIANHYEALEAHPETAIDGDCSDLHQAGKMLFHRLSMLGVWPEASGNV